MNHTMNYMKAVGIILVVAGHISCEGLHWFPIYSFHMPLFIFVSGYLYKPSYEYNIILFLRKKFHSLVLPYYRWNLIYGVIATVLIWQGFCYKDVRILSFKSLLLDPWIYEGQFIFNAPSWFVLQLFVILVASCIIRKVMGKFALSEYSRTVIFGVFCYLGIYWAVSNNMGQIAGTWEKIAGLSSSDIITMHVCRTLFGMFFFQIGILYREKLEKYDGFSALSCFLIILMHGGLLYMQGNLNVYMIVAYFPAHTIWMPMVTCLTGIYMCLKFCSLLSAYTKGEDWFLNLLGKCSWTIMVNHQFGIWLLNACLYFIKIHGLMALKGFDTKAFISNPDYHCMAWGDLSISMYIAFGLGFSLLVQLGMNRLGVSR